MLAAQAFNSGGGVVQPADINASAGPAGLTPRVPARQGATESPRIYPASNSSAIVPPWSRETNDSWQEKQGDAPPLPTEQTGQAVTPSEQKEAEEKEGEKKAEKKEEEKEEKKEDKKKDEKKEEKK